MIRFQYTMITILLGMCLVLIWRIYSMKAVPDANLIDLHLSAVRRGIKKDSIDSHERIMAIRRETAGTSHPKVIKAIQLMDSIIKLEDSAIFYLNKMLGSKNSPDSARYYFFKHAHFAMRATNLMINSSSKQTQNTILNLEERLPGKRLPLSSPQGVELLAFVLKGESYREKKMSTFQFLH